MPQTSLGFSGRFWPISRPLFHGHWVKPISVGIEVRIIASLIPTAPAAARVNADPRRKLLVKAAPSKESGPPAPPSVWRTLPHNSHSLAWPEGGRTPFAFLYR